PDYTFSTLFLPSGSIVINGGALSTNKKMVSLALTAQAYGEGNEVVKMCFSNDALLWSDWEPFADTKPWQIESGDGLKRVYVGFQDKNECSSIAYSDSIILDTELPSRIVDLVAEAVESPDIRLSWSPATDNLGVDHYNIYRDTEPIVDLEEVKIILEDDFSGDSLDLSKWMIGSQA
ncbi:MAG: hypothetical protein COS84_06475, partial [Armatimonadetes bacterium CG07_land_8_20_14_0_80_40_9]